VASSADLNIAMVAGEASGDVLAGRLLSGLRPKVPDALIHGIGGSAMEEYGFVSHWPLDKLTVRGLFEVIPRYRELKRIQSALRDQLLAERPAVFIGVDYPGFNLGLEMQLKQAGIPTMHFIGPQIWAWRGGRIKKIAKAVNHMLVIFPFEEEIYRKAGIPATYVGHPLAEVIPMEPDRDAARRALGLPVEGTVVAVLPGSRMSELKYNTGAFVGAARILAQRDPHIRFVVPMAGEKQTRYFQQLITDAGLQDVPLHVVEGGSHPAMAAADAVLVASGTATLEVALFKKPMVIAYRMMRASWEILRHLGYQPWIGLPNILAREFLVPELLQNAATPAALADALWNQLHDEPRRAMLHQRFVEMHHSLLRNTAELSAEAVMNVIARAAGQGVRA
jgi:lipid-A-disaccharide synthase